MQGEPSPKLRGIIPRATEEMFGYIEQAVSDKKKFLVRASYLQVYNRPRSHQVGCSGLVLLLTDSTLTFSPG